MPLSTGTRLGPYEVTGMLGAGGMGEVYRATDTSLGRSVAIKVLPEAFAHDADRLARFEREARTPAVEAVRSEATVERAVFVGHSMGTPVIRQYATMYPQRVAGLVLVDGLVQIAGTAPGFTPPPMTGAEGLKARDEIPGSAHFPMMEKPAKFNQLLTAFLRKVYP